MKEEACQDLQKAELKKKEASPPVCVCWSLHLGMHQHGYLSIFWHKYRWWK